MGLQEWAEDIAQETVLRSISSASRTPEEIFFESVLYVVAIEGVLVTCLPAVLH